MDKLKINEKIKKIKDLKPRNDHAAKFLVAVVGGFVGMLIALSWNNIIAYSLDLLANKFPILSWFGGLFAAILVTIVSMTFAMTFFNHLNTKDKVIIKDKENHKETIGHIETEEENDRNQEL